MLEDRDYMREPDFRGGPAGGFRWSWTVILIISYVVVLIAELLAFHFYPFSAGSYVDNYFALSKNGLEHGYVWQLLTYQFMHAGWLHLFFNSWAIYIFGRELESILGSRKYLALMFSSGIVGGVVQVLMAVLLPQFFHGAVVGASAGAFGLVAAFAAMFPEREITMLVFFVIPVTLTAKRLLIVSAVLAVAMNFFPGNNVANAAHLGGMAMGWFFVRNILQGDWSRLMGAFRRSGKSGARALPYDQMEKDSSEKTAAEEVDPILDKISARGIQSLTARERDILESARKKMSRK
jgi:membrane associated rhomboid family serine protease